MSSITRFLGLVTCLAFLAHLAPTASAAPGDPVRTFGQGGVAKPALGLISGQILRDAVRMDDGRIVAAGVSAGDDRGFVARYLPGGALDDSFGGNGYRVFDGAAFDSVAVGSDGRVTLAGHILDDALVMRLDPDGTPDAGFGAGGRFRTGFDPLPFIGDRRPEAPRMTGVTVLADGSVVSVGQANGCYQAGIPYPECDFNLVLRLDSGGSPMPLDGNPAGTLTFVEESGPGHDPATALIDVLPDGRMVTVVSDFTDSFDGGFASFAQVKLYPVPGAEPVEPLWSQHMDGRRGMPGHSGRVTPREDGGFLIASGSLLAAFTDDGIDTSFGSDGQVRFDPALFRGSTGNARFEADHAALDPEGRIIVVGRASRGESRSTFAARLAPRGQPDPTFDNDGFQTLLPRLPGGPRRAASLPVILDAGDTYLIAGTASSADPSGFDRFALARLEGGDAPHPKCAGRPATWIGDRGESVVTLTGGVAVGWAGTDVIRFSSRSPHNLACGGGGNDRIRLAGGTAFGGPGNDVITGHPRLPGNDYLARASEVMHGGPGNDRLIANQGDDTLTGGPGRDRLVGGAGDDDLFGGPGRDDLFGGHGIDHLFGGPGLDRLRGGPTGASRITYAGRAGSTELSLIRAGRRFVQAIVTYDSTCSPDHPFVEGTTRAFTRATRPIPIRPGGRFDYRNRYEDGWTVIDERLTGRLRGRVVTGRFMSVSPTPWWSACWSGESQRDPWIEVRARLQPKRVQIVRQ